MEPQRHDHGPLVAAGGLEDHEGSVWLGTAKNGLFRATPALIAPVTAQRPDHGERDTIKAVLQDRNGDIWFGSSDDGWRWQQSVGQSAVIEVLP